MYYRRKVLLSLIESFGGHLASNDCQKLMFLFCQKTKQDYYSFFPHISGGFSFILSYDKARLTDLGFLNGQEEFALVEGNPLIPQLRKPDQIVLSTLVKEWEAIRGKNLLRKVYLAYPHYTAKSQIISDLLNPAEYRKVSQVWNVDESPTLFTIGYEGISIDAYLDKLISNNVKALVDVRKKPISRKYGFSKTRLKGFIESAGMIYFHLPALGISSTLRKNLSHKESYHHLFEHYEKVILPNQKPAIEELWLILSKQKRIALTCFEADHLFCHRHKITELIEHAPNFDVPIDHL